MTEPLRGFATQVRLSEPVLIAPRGDQHHRPVQVFPGAWLTVPRCGSVADRWVAVDLDFADLLDKAPCGRCWPDGKPDQLAISDTDQGGTP